ncbi:mdlA, partial [Symbiodinium sp. KB8]
AWRHTAPQHSGRTALEEISKPKSHEEFYQALNEYGRVLDARTAANAFASLARLDTARATARVREGSRPVRGEANSQAADATAAEGRLANRLNSVLDDREDLPPLAATNLLWALAKLTGREPFGQMTPKVCDLVVATVPKLTPRDLSTGLWAVAVLVADAGLRQQANQALALSLAGPLQALADGRELQGVNLTQSLWAAAKLTEHGVSLWSLGITEKLLANVAILLAPAMNAQQPASDLVLPHYPEVAWSGRFVVLGHMLLARMLANCAWGACRVGVPDGQRFYDALANAGMLLMRTKSSAILDQHICGLLWTFAKIEVPTETTRQFMLQVASESRHGGRLWQMNPYHLSSVVWALAKAFTPDNLALSEDLQVPEPVLLALAMAAQRVCEDARPFRAKDLSWIQWGAARVGLAEPVTQMLPAVVRRMAAAPVSNIPAANPWPEERDATEVNAQDFFMVLWSMAALEVGRSTLPEDVAEPFLRAAVSSLQLADPWDEAGFLSISAWSCAKADLRAPADELIAVAIERARQEKANPRHAWDLRSKVLLAYAKVLHPAPPTPSEVDFVADVYEENHSLGHEAQVDEWSSHIFHMAMIYLALRYLPQFRARRQTRPPAGIQDQAPGLVSPGYPELPLPVRYHLDPKQPTIFEVVGILDPSAMHHAQGASEETFVLSSSPAGRHTLDLVKLDHWVVLTSTCRIGASREDEAPDDLILEEGDQLRTVDHAIARIFRDGDVRWLTVPPASQVYRNGESLLGPQGTLRSGYVKMESAEGPLLRRHTAVDTGVTITELASYGEPWVVEHDQVVVRRGPSTSERPMGIMIKDDGKWTPLNAQGAFRGYRNDGWGLFSMLVGSGFKKYVIVGNRGPPFMAVAESDDEGDFLLCLAKLQHLTADDIMQSSSWELVEALDVLVTKAKNLNGIGSGQEAAEASLAISPEMLQKLTRLQVSLEAKEQELRGLREDLANRDAQLQAFKDQLQAMAQEAVQEAFRMAAPSSTDVPADMSPEQGLTEAAVHLQGSSDEISRTAWSEASSTAALDLGAVAAPVIGSLSSTSLQVINASSPPLPLDAQPGSPSFASRLLAAGPFVGSELETYWRLAKAPYNAVRQHHVEEAGVLWEIVADRRPRNTRVIGRRLDRGVVELGFRGTVLADATGISNYANVSTDLDTEAVPLSAQLVPGSDHNDVLVHKGFQDAYLAVQADILQWLEKLASVFPQGPQPSEIHLSGHSLGAALATLSAMHLRSFGWPVVAVVTFGSPPLGSTELGKLYAVMGLDKVTLRIANRMDPVPRLKELLGPFCNFEHVAAALWLGETVAGIWVPRPSSHSMADSPDSYLCSLHDVMDGQVKMGYALSSLRDVEPYLPWLSGFAPVKIFEPNVRTVAEEVRQQLQVDLALLAKGMAEAARELRSYIVHAHEWERALDLEAVVDLIVQHQDMLPIWQDGKMPDWFIRLHTAKRKVYEACLAGLQDQSSKFFPPFLILFLRAGLVLLKAMQACGVPSSNYQKEFERFRGESQHLAGRLDWQSVLDEESPHEIFSLLEAAVEGTDKLPVAIAVHRELRQAAHSLDCAVRLTKAKTTSEQLALDFTILKQEQAGDAAVLCKISVKEGYLEASLCIELLTSLEPTIAPSVYIKNTPQAEETMQAFVAIAGRLYQSLTFFSLGFRVSTKFTDTSLKELAGRLPKSLTSLSLNFWNSQFTDASLKELAGGLPQSLTSLSLYFKSSKFTDASLKELAGRLAQSLTSLSLFFPNSRFTDASLKELAGGLPQSLASLRLFFPSSRLTDASLKELAGGLPQSLTSLSLDFWNNEFTDTSLKELAGGLPQSLTSLSLHFGNSELTDASLQGLAGGLPQSLTSLSLDFRNSEFTDASLKELAGRLPQSLTSLSFVFPSSSFTDASLQELAGRLPQSLTSLSFHSFGFTVASLKEFWDMSFLSSAMAGPVELAALQDVFIASCVLRFAGDVVGVRRRKGNWVELTQDSDVRFKKREGGGDPPIAAMNNLRRHKVSPTGTASSSTALVPESEAWMLVEHPNFGQLLRRARKRKGGLGHGCVLTEQRLMMYQQVIEVCHRRIYKENLDSLWDGEADKLPSQDSLETGIGLGKVNSGIRKPWVLFFGMAADGTVQLTIVYAASGSFLTSLAWPAAASVSSLQRELQKHTPTGAVGDLLSTTGPLAGEKTLSELGITTGAVLEAVLTFDPSPMYLVNPEVTEYLLLFRHDASKKWVYNMDIAPAEAQRIVADMRPVSSGFPGIPIVLSRPGENPLE